MPTSKKPQLTAKTANPLRLYERSVQAPDVDTAFMAKYYEKLIGKPARRFREDFCGTAQLACHWVARHRKNRAIGIDLDGPTLAFGTEHNIGALSEEERKRVELIQADVRKIEKPRAEIICALNFSYSFFTTRKDLGAYFAHARHCLARDGVLFLDAWGGSEVQTEQEEERDINGFTYVWDQHKFDPITHAMECRIHFDFEDGSRLRNAFVYKWRLWTLPELQELLIEAGFRDVHVLWEGTSKKSGEGNAFWKGGAAAFFFKGNNGRWRDVLTEDDLAMYEAAKGRVLSPDCAAWLEQGGPVSASD